MRNLIRYSLLTVGALIMLLPFCWMIVTSLQTPADVTVTINWLPKQLQWSNYLTMWHAAPFLRYTLNSLGITLLITAGQLLFSILAAFAFTHLHFFGQRWLFWFCVAMMMVPGEFLLVPNFITLTHLHWIDTYAALIVPFLASIFALFTFRQTFYQPAHSLYYAAKLDGASDWQYIWQILIPTQRSAITAVAILQAISAWNSFMWPLIFTNSDRLRTLPVGLVNFSTEAGPNYPLLMAATVWTIAPLLIFYLCLQKQILHSFSKHYLKGIKS